MAWTAARSPGGRGVSDPTAQAFEAAKTMHLRGRVADAERLYREALRSNPAHLDALHGLGVLCLQTGRPQAAVEYLRQAAAGDAGSAMLHNNLGVALCQLGYLAEAAEAYRRAVAAEPDSVQSLTNLGHVLALLGRNGEALSVLAKAVALEPGSREANSRLGAVLLELKRPDEALAPLQKAAALEPQRAESRIDLGSALVGCGRFGEAAEQFRAALARAPDAVPALCGLGEALGKLDRHDEAAATFARALARAPGDASIHYNLGSALTFLGRIAEAGHAFARAAALEPDVPSYRYAAMATKTTAADDPDLKALERMAGNAERYAERERAELHIALAKAYDDLKRYDEAFGHLERGNAIKRRMVTYDEAKEIGRLRAAAETFTREFLDTRAGEGNPSPVPVFIVGMPRSGTTLVEQILASHPAVFGAGEQPILPQLVNGGRAGEDFPGGAATLDAGGWRHLGDEYLERLAVLAPQASRITDKMPGNFLYAGLIRLMLPGARIVHVQRDALDTCFSCYTKLFDGDVNYAYDLAELGRYYRAYQALMAHWRSVIPPEAMLELSYERLIEDLETEARRLVGWCGLEWDERCLAFHEAKRSVRTASAIQVRRPLYKSAVGRAAPYRQWLEPLLAALGATTS